MKRLPRLAQLTLTRVDLRGELVGCLAHLREGRSEPSHLRFERGRPSAGFLSLPTGIVRRDLIPAEVVRLRCLVSDWDGPSAAPRQRERHRRWPELKPNAPTQTRDEFWRDGEAHP